MTPTDETPRKASIPASDADAANVRLAQTQESAIARQADKRAYETRDMPTS